MPPDEPGLGKELEPTGVLRRAYIRGLFGVRARCGWYGAGVVAESGRLGSEGVLSMVLGSS